MHGTAPVSPSTSPLLAFLAGAAVGTLGGLIGLGGAEFRLPLLIGMFGFVALSAVILNKAMSLIVVAAALLFRTGTVPVEQLVDHWQIIVNLLGGSMLGAWWGATLATRVKPRALYRIMAVLLVAIAIVLVLHPWLPDGDTVLLDGGAQIVVGLLAGFGIGAVASLLGVAGGELLIPTIVLLYGIDIKTAGSLSLAVSLPTMIAGFARYSRDSSFRVLRQHRSFVLVMAAGSVVGAATGAALLGIVPDKVLLPALALILVVSARTIWRHG